MRRFAILAAALSVTSVASPPKSIQLELVSPTNGATVEYRQRVSGTVSDPDARVWLVIHPMETSEYWVQPPTSPNRSGQWTVRVYFGRSEVADAGKEFQIRAFTGAVGAIKEGLTDTWPAAAASSDLIEVVRK
jgi:hypothetical protein